MKDTIPLWDSVLLILICLHKKGDVIMDIFEKYDIIADEVLNGLPKSDGSSTPFKVDSEPKKLWALGKILKWQKEVEAVNAECEEMLNTLIEQVKAVRAKKLNRATNALNWLTPLVQEYLEPQLVADKKASDRFVTMHGIAQVKVQKQQPEFFLNGNKISSKDADLIEAVIASGNQNLIKEEIIPETIVKSVDLAKVKKLITVDDKGRTLFAGKVNDKFERVDRAPKFVIKDDSPVTD